MNRRQKLVQQQFLNNEEAVIKRLKQVYGVAQKDIDAKIEALMKRFDPDTGDLPQSVIYQIKYQEMLKVQVDGILKKLQTQGFLTVSDYLDLCYEDGFVGSLFNLHGQGVPLAMPLNQESMVKAVQLDSKISQGLYTRLGEDVDLLKKKITAQVSRSIATGVSFQQTAKQLAGYTRIGYNNAIRIARTEGHRIQCSAAHDAAQQAKDRGADIVKKWDATLDGKTRESHVAVDGQIRELDEKFGNGLMFPGDPAGGAAEVINCRCAYLQKARRWLDGSFTKVNNFTKQIESFDSPDDYEEFKKGFFSDGNKKFMNYAQQMEDKYGTKDWNKILDQMSDREYRHYSKLLANNPLYNTKSPVKIEMPENVVNRFGQTIVFDDRMNAEKWKDSVRYIRQLASEYDTRLTSVKIGAKQAAGTVDMGGTMRLSASDPATAFHEFAHCIAMESMTKVGLVDDSAFWKEVRKIRTRYRKDVDGDINRKISTYADSGNDISEFMAEAFTHAKMHHMGIPLPDKYGTDFTYSDQVLAIIDEYFKKQ
jgi:hypothetical protein